MRIESVSFFSSRPFSWDMCARPKKGFAETRDFAADWSTRKELASRLMGASRSPLLPVAAIGFFEARPSRSSEKIPRFFSRSNSSLAHRCVLPRLPAASPGENDRSNKILRSNVYRVINLFSQQSSERVLLPDTSPAGLNDFLLRRREMKKNYNEPAVLMSLSDVIFHFERQRQTILSIIAVVPINARCNWSGITTQLNPRMFPVSLGAMEPQVTR